MGCLPARVVIMLRSPPPCMRLLCCGEASIPNMHRLSQPFSEHDDDNCSGSGVQNSIYVSLLRHCADARSIIHGRYLHTHIARWGLLLPLGLSGSATHLSNLLIRMYDKCGDVDCAQFVFDRISPRDSFSWNLMITACTRNGCHREALCLFMSMLSEGFKPGKCTFLPILSAAASLGDLAEGKRIHQHIADADNGNGKKSYTSDPALQTALLKMYAKCGCLTDACFLFDKIQRHDRISWTAIISAYAQHGRLDDALESFRRMHLEHMKPDKVTFLCLLNACKSNASLEHGKQLHECIATSGLESDITLINALLNMYSRCGSFNSVLSSFNSMRLRDIVSWNVVISACVENNQGKKAMEFFQLMKLEGVKPDKITFLGLVNACTSMLSLHDGRAIHKSIISRGFDSDVAVNNALLNMYIKCGSLKEALAIFDGMHHRDVISWSTMIAAYEPNGHSKAALELYWRMELDGVKPDKATFLALLNTFSGVGSLEDGRIIHKHMIASGLKLDIALETTLLSMYGKCGSPKEAECIFERMHHRDAISWNAMLAAYAQNGLLEEALDFARRMDLEGGVKPDKSSFLCLLNACADLSSSKFGRITHEYICMSGLESDISVKTAILNMYGKCGNLQDAYAVFNGMRNRDVISWNAMLTAYVYNGYCEVALELFQKMETEGVKPDQVTFLCVLNACTTLASLGDGKVIQKRILESECKSDVAVQTAILNMYGKCGNAKEARFVFDGMREKDMITWNAMLTAYVQNGYSKQAIQLFEEMDMEGVKPDKITFLCLLRACSSLATLANGREFHRKIVINGFESDIAVTNALIYMYGKCGSLKEAQSIFDGMHRRDVISWSAIAMSYAQNGQGETAFELFQRMESEGVVPDKITFLCLLNACAGLASLESGKAMHEYIVASGFESEIVARISLLSMHGRFGHPNDGHSIFWNAMLEAYLPNGQRWVGSEGGILGKAVNSGVLESDISITNALLNMYGKCGNLKKARSIFDKMHRRDGISWNTMLSNYAQSGFGKEALELAQLMITEGVKLDKVTLCSTLTACNHAGLWDEGWHYFISTRNDCDITPSVEHYLCMIDLFGRVGCLNEAEDMVRNMPIQMDSIARNTFLRAFQTKGDVKQVLSNMTEEAKELYAE